MKFERWHFDSSVVCGDTIDRYPILDWEWSYHPKSLDYGYRGPGLRHGFTGKYCKIFYFKLVLFRHEFGFRVEWAEGQMDPAEALKEYHSRRKN